MQRALDIAQRAATLHERIRTAASFGPVPRYSADEIDNRFDRWRQRAAAGDPALFRKRLSWDGLEESAARRILVDVVPIQSIKPYPDFVPVLQDLLTSLRNAKALLERDLTVRTDTAGLAFESLLRPLRCWAREQLHQTLGGQPVGERRLTQSCRAALEYRLDRRLEHLWGRVLLNRFRESIPFGARLLTPEIRARSQHSYNRFIESVLDEGYEGIIDGFPVLARATITAIRNWVGATATLLQALGADWDALEGLLGQRLRHVTDIGGHSDPHNGGQTVAVLQFDYGPRAVFKPRSLAVDTAFSGMLDWSSHAHALPLRHLRVIDRGNYGWMEFGETRPCHSRAEIDRYFGRVGMLLCLLYLLDGRDCHYENIVSDGEHAYLVDLETLLSPQPGIGSGDGPREPAEVMAFSIASDSVLKTGLLPRWRYSPTGGPAYDVSGLAPTPPSTLPWSAAYWRHLESDGIELAPVQGTMPNPVGAATRLEAADHLGPIRDGFARLYRHAASRAGELINDPASPLLSLRGQGVRFLFRDTWPYGVLLNNTTTPQHLMHGAERGVEFEVLARAFLSDSQRPDDWVLFQSEVAALENLDIPYFSATTTSTAVSAQGSTLIEDYFDSTTYSKVVARLLRLDEKDLERQLVILDGTFSARSVSIAPVGETETPSHSDAHIGPLDLLAEAKAIGDEIGDRALRGDDGTAAWIGLAFHPDSGRAEFRPLGASSYDGVCGIALFLAALHHVSGVDDYKALAYAAVGSIRRLLTDADERLAETWAQTIGIGGTAGLGSVLYVFTCLGTLLNDDSLLDDAERVSSLLRPEHMQSDARFDVASGAAGAILGLLALEESRPRPDHLALARLCGEHLLRGQERSGGWLNLAKRPLAGMSHGASGIGMALARLAARLSREDMLTAAHHAFRYELELYDGDRGNWPDLREDVAAGSPHTPFMTSWCHGAPGIALARLAVLDAFPGDSMISRDLELALATTSNHGLGSVDNICCGNMGRADILLSAGRRLQRTFLTHAAKNQAATVVHRSRSRNGYSLVSSLPRPVFSPGLFRGTAGIGYALLRHLDARLPSVLMLEEIGALN